MLIYKYLTFKLACDTIPRMKNIIKNSILAFILIAFSVGPNFAFAGTIPTIVSADAVNITIQPDGSVSADLTGVVNPNGDETIAYFEPENNTNGAGPFQEQNLLNGTSDVDMLSYNWTGLAQGTTYKFRIMTGNINGPVYSGWTSFTTPSAPSPTIVSGTAVNIDTDSADLTGIVNPNGYDTTAWYETPSGGPFQTQNLLNGTTDEDMTLYNLSGLTPNTNYTFRIIAGNINGSETGSWISFTTLSSGGGGGGGGGGSGSGGGSGGGSSLYFPSVITQNSTNITTNSSTLNGSINPNGYATTGWFEYGTLSNLLTSTETTHLDQGLLNTPSVLSQNLSNLSPNTIYYFRVVANNTYGTSKGTILSFKTEGITAPAPTVSVTTVQATNKTSISAKLNGIFVNQTGTNAEGYFQYGKVSSLGTTTSIINLGLVASTSFSKIITNLDPNTIYFFRAVAKNQGTIYNGNILVFKTLKEVVVAPTVTPEENTDENLITNSLESSLIEDQADYSNMTTAEFSISNGTEKVLIGDQIDYIVNFKNITSKDIENVKITVQLPEEVDFVESNLGTKGNDNTVVFEIKNLVPNQIGSITIKSVVNSNASLNKILVTTAMMSYGIAGTTLTKDEIAYTTNNIVEESTGLEANPLFSMASLPYFLGYFALLLLIIALVIIGRKIYIKNKLNKSTKIITDHINNLEK